MEIRRFTQFTAQSRLISALMSMYSSLERSPENIRFEVTPFVVFMAFAIEAYLNSIGARKIEFWDNVERNSWVDKLEILHSMAGKKAEWGKEPLQFIKKLFTIRDKLAHGKPEIIKSKAYQTQKEALDNDSSQTEQPDWYKKLDRDWAMAAKEKFNISMQYLGDLYDLPESDHLHHSSSGLMIDDEK